MMGAARDIDLRIQRARKHLKELQVLVGAFERADVYTVSERVEGKNREYVYRLKFTTEPDERIPVIAGDFLHNLRSALNYLMHGLVPSNRRSKTQFPIFSQDPFARDPKTRCYVERDPDKRRAWKRYVEGVDPKVLAYLKEIQPYSKGPLDGHLHLLAALNSLSNSDKHRELIDAPFGLEHAERTIWFGDKPVWREWPGRMMRDGAELFRSEAPVKVEVDGTPRVLIRVGGREGGEMFADGLTDALLYAKGLIIDILSGYLRR